MKAFDNAHEYLLNNTNFVLRNPISETSQRGISAVYALYACMNFTREDEVKIFETLNNLCGKYFYIQIQNHPEETGLVMIIIESKKWYIKNNTNPSKSLSAEMCTINNWD